MKRAMFVLCALLVASVAAGASAAECVRFHLKWMHGAQFAGVYAAEATGTFAEAGLDVVLTEGPATADVLRDLSEGAYDFVLADPSALLVAVGDGLPIVAVSAIYQIDPVVIFALAESGIRRPQDLAGKRVMSFESSLVIHAVLSRVGISIDDIELGPPSFDLNDLYSGFHDAWSGYIPNEVRRARVDGYDVEVIYPTDYGVHLYGDVLVTRRDLVEQRADLVQRVVDSILDGWVWVHMELEEAATLSSRWNPDVDPADEREILELSLPFIHAGNVPLGGMTDERWQDMAEMMQSLGLLPASFDVGSAYMLRFVADNDDRADQNGGDE